MLLRSALIFLAFLVLMGACTEVALEQPATGTGQAAMQGPQVGDGVQDNCDPPLSSYPMDDVSGTVPRVVWDGERYIRWLPDGSRILFNGFVHPLGPRWPAPDLYSVAPDGAQLDKIVNVGNNEGADRRSYYWDDATRDPITGGADAVAVRQIVNVPDRDPIWGDGGMMMYFDISPDGSHIVYSTCAYTEDAERELTSPVELVVSDIENPEDTERKATARGWVYNYEIVLSDIDGGNARRLTTNLHPDNFPVWSPDGSRIAFITNRPDGDHLAIYTVATDSLHDSALNPSISFHNHSMSWSPDGKLIALVGKSSAPRISYRHTASVFVVDVRSFRQRGIWWAASGPAWSPDGQRIALVVPKPDGVALYTFAVNGTDPILVTENLPEPWDFPIDLWLGDLEWSPDGTEILLKGFTYRVPLDGSPPIGSPLTFIDRDNTSQVEIPMDSAWSPDGSTIAVRIDEWNGLRSSGLSLSDYSSLVFLMDKDNTNIRPLVEYAETADSPSLEIELRLAE